MNMTPSCTHGTNGQAVAESLRDPSKELRSLIPDVYSGFARLSKAAMADGELPTSTKELIALAFAINAQCDGCIAAHARSAARLGVSRQAVAEVAGIAIMMMGGPGTVYGARALDAFDEYSSSGRYSTEDSAPSPAS